MRMTAVRRGLAPFACAAALALTLPAPASAGAWLTPALEVAPGGGSARIALGPNGSGFVVWARNGACANGSCTESQIFARRLLPGNHMSPAFRISPDNEVADQPKNSVDPAVAVDGQGRALVAWRRGQNPDDFVEVVRLGADGVPEFQPVPVSDPFFSSTELPRVAVSPSGAGVVVWKRGFGVDAVTVPAGGPPPSQMPVVVDGGPVGRNDVAIASDGTAVVTWTELVNGNADTVVRVRRLSPTTGLGTERTLDTFDGQHLTIRPAVGIDSSGVATVLWQDTASATGDTTADVEAARLLLNDTVVPLGSLPQSAFGEAPRVAVAPDGGALAAWIGPIQIPGGATQVFASRIAPSGAAGNPMFVSTGNVDAGHEFALAPEANGNATAAWLAGDANGQHVQASRIPASGSPLLFPDLDTGTSGEVPGVAGDGNGNAAIAYTLDGEVRAQRFDGEPPTIASVVVPPTGFTGQALGFGVAATDNLSGVASASWTFGDGAAASGAAATHSYASPGPFGVGVTVTDAAGNSASSSGTTSIAALASGGGATPAAEPLGVTLGRLPARPTVRSLLRNGLRVTVEPSRPAEFTVELLGALRGIRLARAGDLVLAERALPLAPGRRSVVLKVSSRLKRLVRRGARLRLRIGAVDAQGLKTTATRAVRVR
jgi:PKD domain